MEAITKIRNYIRETGRTQAYLCKHTGLSNSAMSLILAGKRRLRLEEYHGICNALQVEPNFFLVGNRQE
ncbi:MAG: helix-turn-helix domain-containing protein [Oscillospiraceae bacterium]|nr:helix-turn-helix domain-containing protein [Oscillospiraceae bacterium]